MFSPNLEASKPVIEVNEVSYGKVTWQNTSDHSNNGQPHPVQFHITFRENNKHPRGLFRKSPGQQAYKKIVCYFCKGEHLIKDCVMLAKEKFQEKQKDTEVVQQYKNILQDAMQIDNITIKEASFGRAPETAYSVEQMEQLLGNLQLDESNRLDRFPCQVTVDEVCQGHIIKFKVTVNNVPVNVPYNTGAAMSCMAKRVIGTPSMKPKLIPCKRFIAGMGGETLRLVGECFICLQIGKRVFRERVVVIHNLTYKYILGQVLHRSYQFSTSYSTTGKHYITINGQVIVQSMPQLLDYPIIKMKGRITSPPVPVSIIEVRTPKLADTTNLYKMNASTFQLLEGIILLDVLHRVDHKTPQYLNSPDLNTSKVSCSIGKNRPLASMHPVGKCEEVQKANWNSLQCYTSKPLPQILHNTRLQLEQDPKSLARSIPDADIPEEAITKLQELLDGKCLQIISQNAMDIGRTNLIKLDILMEGPPIMSKPYTVLLKYCEFIDHEIKQLEEADIISQSMSDWASPILVVPKKQDHMDSNNSQGSNNFNLQLCNNYKKLNSHIKTAHQIKADGTLGKVISNYPLPTINSI